MIITIAVIAAGVVLGMGTGWWIRGDFNAALHDHLETKALPAPPRPMQDAVMHAVRTFPEEWTAMGDAFRNLERGIRVAVDGAIDGTDVKLSHAEMNELKMVIQRNLANRILDRMVDREVR